MSGNAEPDRAAMVAAEEILRTIYGDDFAGCNVSLEKVARLIADSYLRENAQTRELLDLYEKLVEAIHLLSTPPDPNKVKDSVELQTLLSQRLDTINTVTMKTMETTARAKAK